MHKKIKRDMARYCQKLKESYPVILITGPRQSGKTTFAREHYKHLPYVNLEDLQTREAARLDPKGLIAKYPKGAVFDEIQKIPSLTSYLQGFVDEESFKGQFILTGSQNFSVMNTLSQSLAGRAALLHLLPFSLLEISHYTDIKDLEELLYRGFYPRISHRNLNPTNAYGDYISTYLERDIRQLELIKKLNHFQRFVKLSAGRVGQIINYNSFSNDVGVSVSTIQEWLTLLEASYIIFRLPPFFENIGKRLIKQPKLYFYDVGLVSYLLGIEKKQHLETHPLRGHLFENFIISEIVKQRFNTGKDFNFYFYQDSNRVEIDLLILNVDKYDLFEIKSSKTWSSHFKKSFSHFSKACNNKMKSASVIYSGSEELSFDFIKVIPYTRLKQGSMFS